MGSRLYAFDPLTNQNREWNVGQHVGTIVPFASSERSNEVMLAVRDGFASFNLETEVLTIIDDPEAHLPGNRFNDGKCDPAGRFWAGTMAYEDQNDQGSLYRLDTDLSVHKMLGDIGISNGIIWSLDGGTMYYTDSLRYNIRAFDYDLETGDASNERVIIEIPEEMGLPDGFTIDEEGMLWVAHFGGAQVCRWDPKSAKVLQTIQLPTSRITSCAFEERVDTLITSACFQMSDEERAQEPHAGGLFSIKSGVRGVVAGRFG